MALPPNKYFRWLERELKQAAVRSMEEQAQVTVNNIRSSLPANRRRTREAVRRRVTHSGNILRARISLDFARRYRSRGTETEQIFRRTWQRVRPHFLAGVRRRMTRRITEI